MKIEKMMFMEDADIEKLPEVWNQKYKDYMGISPKDDASGILQDTHWWGELDTSFLCNRLGIASQLYYKMLEVMPLEQYLQEGNLRRY